MASRFDSAGFSCTIKISILTYNADYKHTAYVFIGGLPFELSEGDIIAIFSQYGEPVHLNLIRDKETGKSKGFAFLKYEDQRSTNLAVDNLTGTQILGRTIRVDHTEYKQKEGEEPEDAFAGLNLLPKKNKDKGSDDDVSEGERKGSKRRRRDREEDVEDDFEKLERAREERELRKLEEEHDEDDPMRDYLIRQKKEEHAEARASRVQSKKSSKEHKHRHHHRRREKSKDGDDRRRRTGSRDRSERHRHRSPDNKTDTKEKREFSPARERSRHYTEERGEGRHREGDSRSHRRDRSRERRRDDR